MCHVYIEEEIRSRVMSKYLALIGKYLIEESNTIFPKIDQSSCQSYFPRNCQLFGLAWTSRMRENQICT